MSTKQDQGHFTVVLVYVDDIFVAGDHLPTIEALKSFLNIKFSIKNLGPLKYYLGLEVARSEAGIFLNQRKYALDLLSTANMTDCKSLSLPMLQNTKFDATGSLFHDPSLYRTLIGKLLYLTITRPNIAYSVQALSQFMQTPTLIHFQAAQNP